MPSPRASNSLGSNRRACPIVPACNATTLLYLLILLLSLPLLANIIFFPQSAPTTTSTQVLLREPTTNTYFIVGLRHDSAFSQTVAQAWRLQRLNQNRFVVRSFALADESELEAWFQSTFPHATNLRGNGNNNVLVFKENHLLGNAITALVADLKQSGLQHSFSAKLATVSSSPLPTTTSPPPPPSSQQQLHSAMPRTQTEPATITTEDEFLPIQLTLKSEIVTGFRVNPDKQFTNYRPFANHLVTKYGWQFMLQAPLPAGVILVQDQTTAAVVANRYPKALLNNIGWGGQSCLGGTKGTQLSCRAARALADGCEYEPLRIQPAHHRLWIPQECEHFFQTICPAAQAEELFIQKPTGGQHGSGIKVHRGCDTLRAQFPNCADELYMSQHKFFISPYITPVLLDGHKFDMRTFALIASLDPLLCFYGDGFVRKATTKYSTTNLEDASAHVTNSHSQDLREDHFWDFDKLNAYLNENAAQQLGRDYLFNTFRARAMKVTEFFFRAAQQVGFKRQRGRFQLFAADWILDKNGHAYLLEVNSNPLVASTAPKGLERIFPRYWGELMDLVLRVQTGKGETRLRRDELKPYEFTSGNWRLVLNADTHDAYNTCEAFREEPRNERAGEIPCPNSVEEGEHRRACTLAPGTEDETVYHIVHSAVAGPTVVVLAGMHGNEGAGVVAARYVARNLTPKRGTLVIVERANARGVEANTRQVPPSASEGTAGFDLNRAFTPQSVLGGHALVIALWKLLLNVHPDYYFDLHEGRAPFASFAVNAHLPLPQRTMLNNVGTTTGGGASSVSKGNTIVTSVNAYSLAQHIADATNARVEERARKIFVMGPPIKGGLAAMLSGEFPDCQLMLFESTLNQPLEHRAKQHLFMLSVALKRENILEDGFQPDLAQVEDCVATRRGCEL